MRAPRANALLIGVLVLLVCGLALLATLQFRWIDQVSAAEELRMRASLELAARQFAGDLQSELGEVFRAFGGPEEEDLAAREAEWRNSAAHPSLVEKVYVEQRMREDRRGPFDSRRLELVLGRQRGRPRPPRDDFDQADPGPPPEQQPEPPPATIVKLSRAELTNVVLPELVRRHFSSGYDIAIASRDGILFRTDGTWPDGRTPPDVDLPIRMFGPPDGGPGPPRAEPGGPPRFGMDDRREDRGGNDDEGWHLLIRRHDGGLARVVASARRRNLAVSAGILVILASTIAVLLYLLRRADRLREQQTEFVAAISHELNTPVTALRSAGENLKDGIITDPAKLALYGETIVKESARLGDMIDQVLEFAGMRARRDRGANQRVDIAAIVEDAVSQTRWLVNGDVKGDAVRIVTDIEPDLPQPRGDSRSLTRAVQNLVANAVRHGGTGGWVGVRAFRVNTASIAIRVEDRGPGIDSRDTAHLFEPFYRGRGTSAVRGSGLGLTIVHQVVAAHGGSVEVDRRRREGAAFTITLPLERNGQRNG